MRSTAYKLTSFTVVASALGFLLRWLQTLRIIDEETGLATRGMGISFLVTLVIAIVAAAMAFLSWQLKRMDAPLAPEIAFKNAAWIENAAAWAVAALFFVSAVAQLLTLDSWGETQLGIRRVFALATFAAAAGMAILTLYAQKPEKGGFCRVGSVLLIAFGALWLIAVYKAAASNPVIWSFAIEVLAVCASLMSFYYIAGWFFGEPNPKRAVFCCHFGAFLSIMAAGDDHTIAEGICFAAVAAAQLLWGFLIVSNHTFASEGEHAK